VVAVIVAPASGDLPALKNGCRSSGTGGPVTRPSKVPFVSMGIDLVQFNRAKTSAVDGIPLTPGKPIPTFVGVSWAAWP
jgi:hypothetical protein